MTNCPYCGIEPRASDDHVFPQFLGGRASVRNCKKCNDTFGHSIEGPASSDLAPLVVLLRTAGLVPPKIFTWKRAFRDEATGLEYDIDSNLFAQRSAPLIERDKEGNITGAFYHDDRMKKKFIRAFEARGKRVTVTDHPEYKMPMPTSLGFQLTLGPELRRLMMKIAVATADHMKLSGILDVGGREFLLGRSLKDDTSRTMRDESEYIELDGMRSPLGHLVYVEGNSATRICYGVVQFYGLLQLYVILNDGAYLDTDFAVVGQLSPTRGYIEEFKSVSPKRLPRPPAAKIYNVRNWQEKFNQECRRAFGEKAATLRIQEPNHRIRLPFLPSSTTQLTVFLTPPPVRHQEE